ncbi:uncharacterized protein LOC126787529 [Argentina anserina]|uniref:uncharacterized protein LOC126787529 n=1 Tax=Argentina anserina TaxID=57926 RepID=UPI002176890A|nr:uncharacterized protein LOC126787529 [Potentilla anserina]
MSIHDARARAAKLLEGFEKSTGALVSAQISQTNCQKEEENMMLKKQEEALQENVFLKRFVHVQNERCKEYEGRKQELKNLKDLVNQKKEQLRNLEVYNYGLQLNLDEALKNCSNVPAGRFNPDVF